MLGQEKLYVGIQLERDHPLGVHLQISKELKLAACSWAHQTASKNLQNT